MCEIIPKVSVISVYFNRQDNVKKSIQSLNEQTYKNLEIIIIDDCSTDNTYNELIKISETAHKIKLLKNVSNKGFTRSLIDTIQAIDSKYVAIHGAGDISLPNRIEEQTRYLESNPDVGVVCVDITNIKKQKYHRTEITLNDLLSKNRITHGAVMFRKDVYIKAGGYRDVFTYRQDKDLWFRMSLMTKIHFLNIKLYKIVKINKSVTIESLKNSIPILFSAFAKELIIERIKKGFDAIDLYGNNASLLFNPSMANRLFMRLICVQLRNLKFYNAFCYVKHFFLINKQSISLSIILLFIFLILFSVIDFIF